MIITKTDTTGLVQSEQFTSKKLGMKASGFCKIRMILSDFLYADKILAPIREYSTNGLDAHIAKGIPTRPIKITLPTLISPTYVIRDYGHGMTEEQVWDIYANYGESTKDTSDNQAGAFGIGSKSAFAYTNSFVAISFQNGVKKTYVVHTGGSQEGDLIKMTMDSTDEEDGMEIQIAVKQEDIKDFVNRSHSFFKHWDVLPIFEGHPLEIEPIVKQFEGTNWYIMGGDESCVLMGGTAYPIKHSMMRMENRGLEYGTQSGIQNLFGAGIVFKVSIGEVDMAPTREGLQYTEKTISKLLSLANGAMDELLASIVTKFDSCKTVFEKKCLFGEFSRYGSPMYHLSTLVKSKMETKGYGGEYNLQIKPGENDRGFTVSLYSKAGGRRGRGHRRVKLESGSPWKIECDANMGYVLQDMEAKSVLNRVAVLVEREDNHFKKRLGKVYVFQITNRLNFETWAKKNLFDIPWTRFSSLPIVKVGELYGTSVGKGSSYVYNPKNGKSVLMVDLESTSDIYNNSGFFKIESISKYQKDPVPYVIIERYHIQDSDGDFKHACNFVHACKGLVEKFGVKLPPIAAVRKGGEEKLKRDRFINYIPFSVFIKKLIEGDTKLKKKLQDASCGRIIRNFNIGDRYNSKGYIESAIVSSIATKAKDIMDEDSSAGQFFSKYNEYNCEETKSNVASYFKPYFKADGNDMSDELQKLALELLKDYPLLGALDSYHFDQRGKNPAIEYINLVDVNKK